MTAGINFTSVGSHPEYYLARKQDGNDQVHDMQRCSSSSWKDHLTVWGSPASRTKRRPVKLITTVRLCGVPPEYVALDNVVDQHVQVRYVAVVSPTSNRRRVPGCANRARCTTKEMLTYFERIQGGYVTRYTCMGVELLCPLKLGDLCS